MNRICLHLIGCALVFGCSERVSAQSQWGVVPADAAWGAYTVAWKSGWKGEHSSAFSVRGSWIAGNAALESETLGWRYDDQGLWQSIPGTFEATWSGVRLEGAYRQLYTPVHGGPQGVFVGAYFGLSRTLVDAVEQTDDELGEPIYGAYDRDLASHNASVTTGGLGLEIGWSSQRDAALTWECFVSPMFIGVARQFEADLTRWETDERLDQALVNRMQTVYDAPLPMRSIYLMNVGPWLRAGVVVYWNPQRETLPQITP